MIATFEQIQFIVLKNPNKDIIDAGKQMNEKLRMHVHGIGMKEAIKHCEHFASKELYDVQKKYAISNKDLFGRLLQQEDMVFSARGGSTYFSLPESEEEQLHTILDDVKYGLSLRKWVKNFALQAYRCDPMGIIFIEVDEQGEEIVPGVTTRPNPYPTYKSIQTIYDYLPNGRTLEYVCFRLTVGEALTFGISDIGLKDRKATENSDYFRFVDDAKDVIVQRKDDTVILTTNISQQNPLPNPWGKTMAFVVSDLIQYDNPKCFVSPLDLVVELADSFLNDRSVRDLQKKYHGFAKAVEPLLQCPTCEGQGLIRGGKCPDCSTPNGDKGTGYKMRTKVSDVARFPLSIFEDGSGFDFNKVFGYVSPDIKGWEKQDASLEDLEELMEMTYWGTVRMQRPKPGSQPGGGEAITATESTSNDQPKEAKLNMVADWAEKTESMIADYIGRYWFTTFKKSSISYGRDYILRSPEEYKDIYVDLRTKGAPDSALDMAYKKWKQAEFKNNPVQLAIEMKKFQVEPFPHINTGNIKLVVTDFNDINCKLYFGEWSNTIPEGKWASPSSTAVSLREELKAYVLAKGIKEPLPDKKPILN
jgi:hypothetical protein